MKPANFTYHRPHTVAHAVEILADTATSVAVLAGGQSLVPAMNRRHQTPAHIVDINRISGIGNIEQRDNMLSIGALVRQRELLIDPVIGSAMPVLAEVASKVGHSSTRNRGTFAGSIAYGDPAGEYPSLALALDAQIVLHSHRGERIVPASEFFIGSYLTNKQSDELIVQVRFPLQPAFPHYALAEFSRRADDFAIAGALTLLDTDRSRRIVNSRCVVFGAGPTPLRLTSAEKTLRGSTADGETLRAVRDLVLASVEPPPLPSASSAYRRALVAEMCQRAIRQAWEGSK